MSTSSILGIDSYPASEHLALAAQHIAQAAPRLAALEAGIDAQDQRYADLEARLDDLARLLRVTSAGGAR